VDVRQPDEYAQGHIAGSILMPLDQVAQRAKELPDDRILMTVCRSGARSSIAANILRRMGREVVNLEGGMLAWQRQGLPVEHWCWVVKSSCWVQP
jgi:rhodanese-related sulfurtransferase